MPETAYLLRSPANAEWIAQGLAEARDGEAIERDLD
jgi:PHD/YefM family antitoxin component YafN of YafNO toxin-antitoxin module